MRQRPECKSNGTVTVIDGATLASTNIFVGMHPYGLALNSATNRIYVPNYLDEHGLGDGWNSCLPLCNLCR